MLIPWYDRSVRLTGRWSDADLVGTAPAAPPPYTLTTAPGAYFELAFTGEQAVLHFDMTYPMQPYPHLWISVDHGPRIEAQLDRYIRIHAGSPGQHLVQVLYKGGMEQLHRWVYPQYGSVAFIGAQAVAAGTLPPDHRPLIEFIGDSNTEGVLIDTDFAGKPVDPLDQYLRPYQDDHCATYAYLTAKALNLRPMIQAYSAVGLLKGGYGGVPRAGEIYPYVVDQVPYRGPHPAIVVINHGANDRRQPAERYLQRYEEFLDMVRATHPAATVIALSPFCGAFDAELSAFIPRYNARHGACVHFISSKGWVAPQPLHPLRDGHRIIAQHLSNYLRQILSP